MSAAEGAPGRVLTFDDTPEGREALRRHLLERFGPRIEWRAKGRGVELRAARSDRAKSQRKPQDFPGEQ